jgi:hypothetical protein
MTAPETGITEAGSIRDLAGVPKGTPIPISEQLCKLIGKHAANGTGIPRPMSHDGLMDKFDSWANMSGANPNIKPVAKRDAYLLTIYKCKGWADAAFNSAKK